MRNTHILSFVYIVTLALMLSISQGVQIVHTVIGSVEVQSTQAASEESEEEGNEETSSTQAASEEDEEEEEDEEIPAGSAVDAALYERASELGETFGVEILIADQCQSEYYSASGGSYSFEQELDEEVIAAALDTLEEALSAYPEGFFEQLCYDTVTVVRIYLCGTITPPDTMADPDGWFTVGVTGTFATRHVMLLDAAYISPQVVYHEFSHVIEEKLAWDASNREDALFSEEAWAALNPEGFEYTSDYSEFDDLEFEDELQGYFVQTYSMVSPYEDRATIMAYAMDGYDSYFTEHEGIAAKLRYYCACIRDAFDTTGWPETTAWEILD